MKIQSPSRAFLPTIYSLFTLFLGDRMMAQGIPSNGLVAYFTGDGHAMDSSPNQNHGSFTGGYTVGQVGLAFDLSEGPVVIPNIPEYQFSDGFSVSFWFQGTGPGSNAFIGHDDGGGGQQKWFIDYGYANSERFEIHLNGNSFAFLPADYTPVDFERWNNLAVVKEGSAYSFYLNGTTIGTQEFTGSFPSPTAPLTLGYAEPGIFYTGALDEVLIYNRALSFAEVQQLAAVPELKHGAIISGILMVGFAVLRLNRGHRKELCD